jgi:hypothetical protein
VHQASHLPSCQQAASVNSYNHSLTSSTPAASGLNFHSNPLIIDGKRNFLRLLAPASGSKIPRQLGGRLPSQFVKQQAGLLIRRALVPAFPEADSTRRSLSICVGSSVTRFNLTRGQFCSLPLSERQTYFNGGILFRFTTIDIRISLSPHGQWCNKTVNRMSTDEVYGAVDLTDAFRRSTTALTSSWHRFEFTCIVPPKAADSFSWHRNVCCGHFVATERPPLTAGVPLLIISLIYFRRVRLINRLERFERIYVTSCAASVLESSSMTLLANEDGEVVIISTATSVANVDVSIFTKKETLSLV